MTENLEDHTPQEIAEGTSEFIRYLEECDSQVCDYTWEALIAGSVAIYERGKAA